MRQTTARVVIIDFGTGRMVGGHNADYLASLERSLADLSPVIVAPFRNGSRLGRVATYRLQLRVFVSNLRQRRTLIVSHSPEFRDIVLFWLATRLVPSSRAIGVFLFRRAAEGIVGTVNWRSRLLERIVPGLIRSGHIYPVSDSRLALEAWTLGTGTTGSLIAVPPPLGWRERPRRVAGPVIGLVGRLRVEKGAGSYDLVIRESLAIDDRAKVKAQLSEGAPAEEAAIASGLRNAWSDHPRVELVNGHLSPKEYADLILSTDVVVLPYDLATYGSGTSGVMHDTLSMGRVVLATPIEWAAEKFAGREDVVWLEGLGPSDVRAGLRAAVARALARRGNENPYPSDQAFAADWSAALVAAEKVLDSRE